MDNERKMSLKEEVDNAWMEYYNYRREQFGGLDGFDDYSDIPDDVYKVLNSLRSNAIRLQTLYSEEFGTYVLY